VYRVRFGTRFEPNERPGGQRVLSEEPFGRRVHPL